MSSEFLELRIPITDNTTKKIVALAALTGKSLTDIKEAIAADLIDEEAFDAFVSQQLHGALAELDGTTEDVEYRRPRKNFSQAEQDSMDAVDNIAGHSLSGDEDTGSQSLEDQYVTEEKKLRGRPASSNYDNDFQVDLSNFPDAGSNVDAFINIDEDQERPRQASLGKSSRIARDGYSKVASISEYTGE